MLEYTVHVRALRIWKEVNGEKRLTPASWTTITPFHRAQANHPQLVILTLCPAADGNYAIPASIDRETGRRLRTYLFGFHCGNRSTMGGVSRGWCRFSAHEALGLLNYGLRSRAKGYRLRALWRTEPRSNLSKLADMNALAAMPTLEHLTLPSFVGTPRGNLSDQPSGFHNLRVLHLRPQALQPFC